VFKPGPREKVPEALRQELHDELTARAIAGKGSSKAETVEFLRDGLKATEGRSSRSAAKKKKPVSDRTLRRNVVKSGAVVPLRVAQSILSMCL
jgi:plasmid stability protein